MSDETMGLRLTLAHHDDNEFYDLGEIVHEVSPQALWDTLAADPATECCHAEDSHHDMCFLVDQVLHNGVGDSREVTVEQAKTLLGRDPMEAFRDARHDLATVYASIGSLERAVELHDLADAL